MSTDELKRQAGRFLKVWWRSVSIGVALLVIGGFASFFVARYTNMTPQNVKPTEVAALLAALAPGVATLIWSLCTAQTAIRAYRCLSDQCEHCGYQLAKADDSCPECGRSS